MKLGKYHALEDKAFRSTFLDYLDAIEIPVIDYMAIGVQDTLLKTSTSIMSRPDWQTAFKALNLAEHDPVRKAAFNTKTNLFSFNELDYSDSFGSKVMQERRRYGIENGMVLIRRHLGYNFMLTLATGYKNFQPYKYLLEHQQSINYVFNDLISLIKPVSEKFHHTVNHPSDDAR